MNKKETLKQNIKYDKQFINTELPIFTVSLATGIYSFVSFDAFIIPCILLLTATISGVNTVIRTISLFKNSNELQKFILNVSDEKEGHNIENKENNKIKQKVYQEEALYEYGKAKTLEFKKKL